MMVYCPIDRGEKRLNTYGTLDMGEVPNRAFVMTAMLNALIKTEHKNKEYLR